MTKAVADHIDEAVAALEATKRGDPYVPTSLSEQIAAILFKPMAPLGKWSVVAKALTDQGQALALYDVLFPDDRWILGKGQCSPGEPEFGFAIVPPYQTGEDTGAIKALVVTEHDVCAIAIMMGALMRRKQLL